MAHYPRDDDDDSGSSTGRPQSTNAEFPPFGTRSSARPPRQQQHAPALDTYLPNQPTPAKLSHRASSTEKNQTAAAHWQHIRDVCAVQLLPRLKSLAPAAWDAPKP
ncbi:uncharacterized protein B0T23DRAFT_193879 [Neurospora hispaniola]|uniref:Uncharacterized protein n=1 Tax=Neurospora hispaniola TaxID=588809 RepID=A0AAJ0MPM3_9PEZI|nr:hypothetical protein B0T23DRAFT_193879 [Neurospora hispaniola]